MHRSSLPLLFAFLAPPLHAADVELFPLAEPRVSDGTAAAGELAVMADGRMVASVYSSVGDLALVRYDAQGNETSRWIGAPRQGPYSDTVRPIIAFDLRPDGLARLNAPRRGGSDYVLLDTDGQELLRQPIPGGGELVAEAKGLGDGFTVYHATAVRSFDGNGALRAEYRPQHVFVADVSARANGGYAVIEAASRRVRGLDADLRVEWTQDFLPVPAPGPTIREVVEGPGGSLLAVGVRFLSDASAAAFFALLDANGDLLWHVSTPPYARGIDVDAYAHVGGFGFLGVARGTSTCLLQGSIASDGTLDAVSCDAVAGVPDLLPLQAVAMPEGMQMLASDFRDGHVFAAKTGAAPATLRLLATGAEESGLAEGTIGAGGPAGIAWRGGAGERRSRLMRWESGAQPTVDVPTPVEDEFHTLRGRVADAAGELLYAFQAEAHVDLVHSAAGGGADWRLHVPTPDGVSGLAAAADGSYRLLSGDDDLRLTAVTNAGQIAWTHPVPGTVAQRSQLAVMDNGSALVGYGAGGECRVRRIDATGNLDGDRGLGATGMVLHGTRLATGAVFVCGPEWDTGGVLAHVDASLDVTPVDDAACVLERRRLLALGGTRWMAIGFSAAARHELRFCSFDGASLEYSDAVALEPGTFLALGEQGRFDEASGTVRIAFEQSPQRIVHYAIHDPVTRRTQAHALRALTMQETLQDVSGPDSRGRVALAYSRFTPPGDSTVHLEFGRPGHGARWRAALPVYEGMGAKLDMVHDELRFAGTEWKHFTQVIGALGRGRADVVFDSDFEGFE